MPKFQFTSEQVDNLKKWKGSQTKEALEVSSEQDENALEDALAAFKVADRDALLDREPWIILEIT